MRRLFVLFFLALIVLAHIGLWSSDTVPVEVKTRLTLLNALGWAVILLPVLAVNRWLKAHERHRDD
mgnify:CR=1 FL=1